MLTTADMVRDMIGGLVHRLAEQGCDLAFGSSERMEALFLDIDAHLRAADLCELLENYDGMTRHLGIVNQLLEGILDEMDA